MPPRSRAVHITCPFCGRSGPHRLMPREAGGAVARCLACDMLHVVAATPAFENTVMRCSFDGMDAPHHIVRDTAGSLAWCQICYRVSALGRDGPSG